MPDERGFHSQAAFYILPATVRPHWQNLLGQVVEYQQRDMSRYQKAKTSD